MKKYYNLHELEDAAYQCAYKLSNDWMKESPTWDDVKKAYVEGYEAAAGKHY